MIRAAIISAGTRPNLTATLRRDLFDSFGILASVHSREDRSRIAQHQNTLSAMRDLSGGGLFLEDDLRLEHPRVLREALRVLDRPTILCLVQPNNLPPHLRRVLARGHGKVAVQVTRLNYRGFGGSQAVYWPPNYALDFLAFAETKTKFDAPSDVMFRSYWEFRKLRVDLVAPNPFQHVDTPSVISSKKRISPLESDLAKLEPIW